MRWAKGATEFTVGVTRNKQNNTRYSYILKPVMEFLGYPPASSLQSATAA